MEVPVLQAGLVQGLNADTVGDIVAQLVRCRTSNQRVAGSIPGRGTLVCPWARQFIPYCFSLPSCKMGT